MQIGITNLGFLSSKKEEDTADVKIEQDSEGYYHMEVRVIKDNELFIVTGSTDCMVEIEEEIEKITNRYRSKPQPKIIKQYTLKL